MKCPAAYSALVICLFIASPTLAQSPRGEVAGAFLAGKEVGGNCSDGGITIVPCSPWGWGWKGSFAVYATERVSLLGRVSGMYRSVDAELRIQEPSPLSVPFSTTSDTLAIAGGVRVHGDRAMSVRPFVLALFGYSVTDATVGGFGGLGGLALEDDMESVSVSGSTVIPGVGVDVAVADRVSVRLEFDFPLMFSGAGRTQSFSMGAGLVLALGR